MAIALLGSSGGNSGLNTNILSFSVTVPPGTDFATVGLGLENFTGTITSVIFNGSEQLQQRIYQTNASSNRRTAIFYLANPTVTTANLVVLLSGNANQIFAGVQAWTDVDPASGANGNAVGRNNAPSNTLFELDVPTSQPNSLVVDAFAVDNEPTIMPVGDNTGNEVRDSSSSNIHFGMSFAEIAATGTANMDWSLSQVADGSMCAMELLAADGGGGTDLLLLLNARGDN